MKTKGSSHIDQTLSCSQPVAVFKWRQSGALVPPAAASVAPTTVPTVMVQGRTTTTKQIKSFFTWQDYFTKLLSFINALFSASYNLYTVQSHLSPN